MSERSDAWREAAEYAAQVAGVGEKSARDRGVSVERMARMRTAFELLKQADKDAFYVEISRHANEAALAVARLLDVRADSEVERAMQNEPTNPNGFVVPPEAIGGTDG